MKKFLMNNSRHHAHHHAMQASNHSGMTMYFNLANPFYLFFKEFFITSFGAIFGGAIVLFFLTLLYEGLKTYREVLFFRCIKKNRKYSINNHSIPTPLLENPNHDIKENIPVGDTEVIQPKSCHNLYADYELQIRRNTSLTPFNRFVHRRFNRDHLFQTVLHLLQTFLSYLIMLAFMTFNVWICLAIILGSMSGYFLFGWRKSLILENLDHCH